MAEDDEDMNLEDQTDDPTYRENKIRRKIDQENRQRKEKCRPRIDVLATPNRRLILDLYRSHASHLPEEKVEKVKKMLQELYAMTPEETHQYFSHIHAQQKKLSLRREMKSRLKKLVRKRNRLRQRCRAYLLLERTLKRGMEHAFYHPVPPLVSVRLRNLSDIVLEQICDLRNLPVPDRDDPDQVGLLLIAIADWFAIAIEHLYYNVQLKKNKELDEIEAEEEQRKEMIAQAERDRIAEEKRKAKLEKKKAKKVQSEEVKVQDLSGNLDGDKGGGISDAALSEVE